MKLARVVQSGCWRCRMHVHQTPRCDVASAALERPGGVTCRPLQSECTVGRFRAVRCILMGIQGLGCDAYPE